MCRLLAISVRQPTDMRNHLRQFARIAQNSREYQGDGWGCAWLEDGHWSIYKNVCPIWEDNLTDFPATNQLLVHARSAFRNEGIAVENNMPFADDKYAFIFNGELHGVRIKEQGRIGAEKIFNYIKRFDHGDMLPALEKSTGIIAKRTTYIRAMNIILSDKRFLYLHSLFNEDADYFTMFTKTTENELILCSEKYPGETGWQKIENETIEGFRCLS
ncbi:class II glutamine amidotransferase [candidate division KSB1 bacterium]|nr:class II glutamine amidotransferase [candidate division KSB1 bacterium]